MQPCECTQHHVRQRVVLTGGPGAGKTAVLELVRQHFCRHIVVLPESASILFSGGFPRGRSGPERAAAQRAIFYVQRELEATAEAADNAVMLLCDRGTVDGAAYWPGPGELWPAVGTTLAEQLARYEAVIHLRTPPPRVYNHQNPLRTETPAEASEIDERLALVWATHSRRFVIDSEPGFFEKARRALEIVWSLVPECCRPRGAARLSPAPGAS